MPRPVPRSLTAAITAAVLLGALLSPAQAQRARTSAELAAEDCFRDKLTAYRRANKVKPLVDHPHVTAVARRHSDEMADRGTIYHDEAQLDRDLSPYEAAGENVGMGGDCQSIHDAWRASAGHRENMLDHEYRYVGTGVTIRGDTIFVTVDFWTPVARAKRAPDTSRCSA